MASSSRVREEPLIPKKSWPRNHKSVNRGVIINNCPDTSPDWIEPNSKTKPASARKVPVLYYLSRNGHLEHPHLVDVTLSSPHGLYLRDVMNTLNYHRGKGMANMYSWSFKRSYKSGYVWHDASEEDLIQPTNGHDYVVKGSQLLQTHASRNLPETCHTGDNCSSTNTAAAAMVVKRNQSWSSFDIPQDYLVLKCESNRELGTKFAPDAATQTVELSREEIPSPPPSNSSSDVVSGSRSRYIDQRAKVRNGVKSVEDEHGCNGRMTASQVLLQLITCGADSVRHVVPVKTKHDQGCTVSVAYGKSLRGEVLNQ
ncbi:protein UPSTREAM OF FLC-like [Cynara cardunculus var. scolymus]|uniref:protein UPSTREAM OF FLC-like n=1 Tax=Cynara cardunculus var. scolymus TaxID=59895 RepID=UPI000D625EE2|nr:protein UPSTREAM OF FLC-like [Cynara cardunculus var. scolymus]